MKLQIISIVVAIAFVIGWTAVLIIQLRDKKTRAENSISDFCKRQELGLKTKVSDTEHHDLRAAMRYRFLDQGACKMCLGREIPVDEKDADTCWVATGNDACYAELAVNLLKMYQER
jgi:hypothetical protein